jgi:2,5-diamino-6-(ribosylamino)-4(3H)-pyrimidinone 5'-phosphate reductase
VKPFPEAFRLFPDPRPLQSVGEIYSDLEFPRRNEYLPYVYINMVSSLDGKSTLHGSVAGIGGRADRCVMDTLRSKADAVLIGAGTLRAEKVRLALEGPLVEERIRAGLGPQPLQVFVTVSGRLPLENLIGSSKDDVLLFVPEDLSTSKREALAASATISPFDPNSGPPMHTILRTLIQTFHVNVLLSEGGPTLNHSLIRDHLAEELFLTLSPKVLGGKEALTIVEGDALETPGPNSTLKSLSAYMAEEHMFLRYSFQHYPVNFA